MKGSDLVVTSKSLCVWSCACMPHQKTCIGLKHLLGEGKQCAKGKNQPNVCMCVKGSFVLGMDQVVPT